MDGKRLLAELLLLVAMVGGEVFAGFAPHYSKGLMKRVAQKRGIPAIGCLVSSARFPLQTKLYVYGVKTGQLRACTVIDVSHPRDKARHIRNQREVEVSFEDMELFCGHTRGRPEDCPVIVIKIGGAE